MDLLKMEYIDKTGNPTNIDVRGTKKFKYRIVAIILIGIIIFPLLILAGLCDIGRRIFG